MNKKPSSELDDINIQSCSTTDCTGLIPALPQSEAELESYEDLYPYITHSVPVKNNSETKDSVG